MSGDSAQSAAQMRVKDACEIAISRADCMMTAGALGTLPKQTQRPGTSTVLYMLAVADQNCFSFQANICMILFGELT